MHLFLHLVVHTISYIVKVSYNIIAPLFIVKKSNENWKNRQYFDRLLELLCQTLETNGRPMGGIRQVKSLTCPLVLLTNKSDNELLHRMPKLFKLDTIR